MGMIIFISILVVVFFIYQYNKAQGFSQVVREGHANIIVSMKKRIDLVNKLIDITKGYGEHEKLTHITISKDKTESLFESKVDGTLLHIAQLGSNLPELKANETYQRLMKDLNTIEIDLQRKREGYNNAVKNYNVFITQIPFVLYGNKIGFKQAEYFSISNADTLENIKEFNSTDGEELKNTLSGLRVKAVDIAETIKKKGEKISGK